jgi:hypothetical protein
MGWPSFWNGMEEKGLMFHLFRNERSINFPVMAAIRPRLNNSLASFRPLANRTCPSITSTVIRSAVPLARGPYLISHSSIGLPFFRSFSFRIMWLIMDLFITIRYWKHASHHHISLCIIKHLCYVSPLLILFVSPTPLFCILHYMRFCCIPS